MAKKQTRRAGKPPSKPSKGAGEGEASTRAGVPPESGFTTQEIFTMPHWAYGLHIDAGRDPNPVLARAERVLSKLSRHGWASDSYEGKKRRGEYASTADVHALGMDLFGALSKLMHLAQNAYDQDSRMIAGRILADLVNVWLDRWPDDAPRCVTDALLRIKENVPGFQARWDEINRRGRPRERGFAKKAEAERTVNEELLRNYIRDIQFRENASMESIVAHLLKGIRSAPQCNDHRVKRWWQFVMDVAGHPSSRSMEGWKAFCVDKFGSNASVACIWLEHAINDNFDAYWSMIIKPAINQRHYLSWAKSQKFERESDAGKTKRGIKGDSSRASPPYPLFGEAKKKMKPLLQEIMHPAFRPVFVQ